MKQERIILLVDTFLEYMTAEEIANQTNMCSMTLTNLKRQKVSDKTLEKIWKWLSDIAGTLQSAVMEAWSK